MHKYDKAQLRQELDNVSTLIDELTRFQDEGHPNDSVWAQLDELNQRYRTLIELLGDSEIGDE